jgi:hypothetical protein
MIEIPSEDDYRIFCESNASYNSSCSGVGSCDHCNKKMYPIRGKYLKEYVRIYKQNKDNLDSMPKLFWVASESAQEFKLGDFHKQKCNLGKPVSECTCELSCFMKTCFNNVNEDDTRPSLDTICGTFINYK